MKDSTYSNDIVLHCYPFTIKFNRCVGSLNTLNELSNKVCVPNKTEDLNKHVFNMIIRTNELKTLTKNVSCKFNVNLTIENVIQTKSEITINADACVKIQKISSVGNGVDLESCYF